jgi:uncharacterized SAM-binding protein YcdF (DUF218 family)
MLAELPPSAVPHINQICRYLAVDDFEHGAIHSEGLLRRTGRRQFDMVAVFGNQVLATITEACSLVREGLGDQLLLSGGRGHSTDFLLDNVAKSARYGHLLEKGFIREGFSEAEIFSAIAQREFCIPREKILTDTQSTNTGQNARHSLELLAGNAPRTLHMLVLQDPLMQRRTMLTLSLAAQNVAERPLLFSRAVFVPLVRWEGHGGVRLAPIEDQPWQEDRFLSVLLGEIRRLRNDEQGYGPRGSGFIPAVEIPDEVMSCFEVLRSYGDAR